MHYVAMSGMRGCIPNSCHAYDKRNEAIADLVDTFNLHGIRAFDLLRYGYTALVLSIHGAEYAEIVECNCDNPEVHND